MKIMPSNILIAMAIKDIVVYYSRIFFEHSYIRTLWKGKKINNEK